MGTHPEASERIRTHPNASEQVRTGPSKSQNFKKLAKTSKILQNIRENFAKHFRGRSFPDILRMEVFCGATDGLLGEALPESNGASE